MTTEPTHEDLIRYDVMVQDALLGVVRKVLSDAARNGLPGEHHFYVTFRSQAPGVKMSNRLKEKHPEEMTIVLQHQFWDLLVTDHALEVGLSFGGVPEKLFVPFEAMTGFYDPSVQFGLKFAADEAQADNDVVEDEPATVKDRLEAITEHEKATKKPRARKEKAEKSEPSPAEGVSAKDEAAKPDSDPPPDDAPPAGGGAQVVSLEAFRKKK